MRPIRGLPPDVEQDVGRVLAQWAIAVYRSRRERQM